MSEHWSNLKPDPVECACGCGVISAQRVRAWKDGLNHGRKCACRRCTGGKQSAKARRRENRVAKATGGRREPLSGNLSGIDGRSGLWVWEETAQLSLVQGLRRWWTSKQVTAKTARLMNRHGVARAFIASWDGRPQLVVIPFEDWAGQVLDESESAPFDPGEAV